MAPEAGGLWPALLFLWEGTTAPDQEWRQAEQGYRRRADDCRTQGRTLLTPRALRGGPHSILRVWGGGPGNWLPGPPGTLTQARVGPPLAQAGGFHEEHAGLVRHPRAESQEQGPQADAALEGQETKRRPQRETALPPGPGTLATASTGQEGPPLPACPWRHEAPAPFHSCP